MTRCSRAAVHSAVLVGWAALGAGCGPDAPEEAPFAELCGVQGPVQILDLRPEELASPAYGAFASREDGWLFGITEFAEPITDAFDAMIAEDGNRSPRPIGARIEAVSACGETRVVVADGYNRIRPAPPDDDRWIAVRSDTRDVAWFDPDGSFIYPLGRAQEWSWHSLWLSPARSVVMWTADNELVEFAREADGITAETILPQVIAVEALQWGWQVVPRLFVLEPGGDLLDLDLATGESRTLLTGIGDFTPQLEGRFVLWTTEEAPHPISLDGSALWITELETGKELRLGREHWGEVSSLAQNSVVVVRESGISPDVPEETQLLFLPEMKSIWLQGYWTSLGRAETGEVVLHRLGQAGTFVLDPEGTIPMEIHAGPAHYSWVYGQDVWIEDMSAYGTPTTDFPPRKDDRTDILRVPLATLEPEVVVRDVFQPLAIEGDRWATVRGYAGDYHGDLLLVGDEGPLRIDRDVFVFFARYTEPAVYPRYSPEAAVSSFLYAVRDGDRTGLWRVGIL